MEQDNLTAKQKDYAIFLPALSGFYGTFVGKQRNEQYVDPARFPQGLTDMEQLNWLNDQKALFPYKWSLYSAGHANIDLTKQDWSEDMVRNRDPNTIVLGDSGGFQIFKGLWEGDWKANSGCPKAQKRREAVLKWLDGVATYGMTLDIPSGIVRDPNARAVSGINTLQDAVEATKYNNEYFIKHRKGVKNGGTKFLNVMQGANHADAEQWYQTMKQYCDPSIYPDNHFNGWAMASQNACDMELLLTRLVAMRYDNLLQEGVHDWMHFLGVSRLEWAVLFTVIQRAVRKYVNPSFTVSFDCASPFLATANGGMYYQMDLPDRGKWCYRMGKAVDDKKFATDTRPFKDGMLTEMGYNRFDESPVSALLKMKDICYYKPGDLNKIGKEGKTSWDSFSYMLLMSHNVWTHIAAVQESNRQYDTGVFPAMMQYTGPGRDNFEDIVERIFSAPDRQSALDIIKYYHAYWMEIIGVRGYKGKKAFNSNTFFDAMFTIEEPEVSVLEDEDLDESKLDELESGNILSEDSAN